MQPCPPGPPAARACTAARRSSAQARPRAPPRQSTASAASCRALCSSSAPPSRRSAAVRTRSTCAPRVEQGCAGLVMDLGLAQDAWHSSGRSDRRSAAQGAPLRSDRPARAGNAAAAGGPPPQDPGGCGAGRVSAAGRAAQARASAGPRLGGPPGGAAGAGRCRAAARAGQAGRRADGGAPGPARRRQHAPRPACVLEPALPTLPGAAETTATSFPLCFALPIVWFAVPTSNWRHCACTSRLRQRARA